jgi:hypothetical protein
MLRSTETFTTVPSGNILSAFVGPNGVRTFTRSRHGLKMISQYVSYNPPSNVGMRMVEGTWFFEMMGGGWRFSPAEQQGHTLVTWRYNFRCRPKQSDRSPSGSVHGS